MKRFKGSMFCIVFLSMVAMPAFAKKPNDKVLDCIKMKDGTFICTELDK